MFLKKFNKEEVAIIDSLYSDYVKGVLTGEGNDKAPVTLREFTQLKLEATLEGAINKMTQVEEAHFLEEAYFSILKKISFSHLVGKEGFKKGDGIFSGRVGKITISEGSMMPPLLIEFNGGGAVFAFPQQIELVETDENSKGEIVTLQKEVLDDDDCHLGYVPFVFPTSFISNEMNEVGGSVDDFFQNTEYLIQKAVLKGIDLQLYGLYDVQLEGFVGGFADTNLKRLVDRAFKDFSEEAGEPYSKMSSPDEALVMAGYEIRKFRFPKDYERVYLAHANFSTEVIENIGRVEEFDWEKEYRLRK